MLSISQEMNILSSLEKTCGCHSLNPNELDVVIEILHFVYNEIREQPTPDWVSELVVPDDGCRLVHANSSVYIDAYGSHYVKFCDSLKLRFVHRDVSEKVCLAFGIRKLSDVVLEELDYVKHLHTPEIIGSVSLTAIREKLLSSSFQLAVLRVFNTVSKNTGSENLNFQTLQRSLESIAKSLQFVQCIYTRFWVPSKSVDITHVSKESIIPEWGSGRALYYVDRLNTCMLIAEPPSYVPVVDLVAIVVSRVLGSLVPLPIGSLFFSPRGSESALVNMLKLSNDDRVMDGLTDFLGREVVPEDLEKVRVSLTNRLIPFYKGQIVAWRSGKEEMLKYGRIVEDVKPLTFMYGRILEDVGLLTWQVLCRFSHKEISRKFDKTVSRLNLETFPGKTETINTSLVAYFHDSTINEYSTNLISEDDHYDYDYDYDYDYVADDMHICEVNLRNQGQKTREREHGRVSVGELVKAVEEMLSASGIKMDTEKQSLLLTKFSLQQQLNESQAALVLEQEKLETATKEANAAKVELQCQMCLTNEIEIIVVPCGHVVCCPCSSLDSHCPICRVLFSKRIKLYWP